jgi:PTS system cellobiose-specific IIB component
MKILLICSAGMSTSLLVSKMEKSAEARGIECLIKAVSAADGKNVINDYDVVLLGPQVRYLKSDLQKVTDHPVDVIDMMAYGRMDGERVLNDAIRLFDK